MLLLGLILCNSQKNSSKSFFGLHKLIQCAAIPFVSLSFKRNHLINWDYLVVDPVLLLFSEIYEWHAIACYKPLAHVGHDDSNLNRWHEFLCFGGQESSPNIFRMKIFFFESEQGVDFCWDQKQGSRMKSKSNLTPSKKFVWPPVV